MNKWYKLEMLKLSKGLILHLMDTYESLDELCGESFEKIKFLYKIDDETLREIYNMPDSKLEDELNIYRDKSINIISYKDKEYPYLLKNISEPPPFLYLKGKGQISDKTIGVVGTRKMTREGKIACEAIVKSLARSAVDIVSGLALGVDSCAHRVALNNNSTPLAVVGNGLDIIYPPSNKRLYEEVMEKGLLISELPLGTEPARWTFPRRNRIIAGLSRGVLVAESYESGGSLITAKYALEENRDVFAIPGMISYPSFVGCNNLIKNGEAKLINRAEDILEEYNWTLNSLNKKSMKFSSPEEEIIYGELISPKTLDELIIKSGIKARDLLVLLSNMELEGFVKSLSGGRFSRLE